MDATLMSAVWFVLGAAASWLVTHVYYRRSMQQADAQRFAQRVDWADRHMKAFLIAVSQVEGGVPLYANLAWSGTPRGGEAKSCASNGCIMFRALRERDLSLLFVSEETKGPNARFSLNERGMECARYLKEHEFPCAEFEAIDESAANANFELYGYPPKSTREAQRTQRSAE